MAMMTLLHVVFGTVALIVAPLALAVRKGGTWHRRWGKAFVSSMAIVVLSAGFLWQEHGHLFLVPLGAITAYLTFNGRRVIARRKRRRPDEIDDRADLLAAYAALAAAAATIYLGASGANPLLREIGPALIGIGGIGLAFGLNEVLGFRGPRSGTGWVLAHLSAMIAAYASAVTAFVVINAHAVPMMLRWTVPVALAGATIAAYALRYVRLRLPGLPASRARAGRGEAGSPVVAATPLPGPGP